MEETQVKLIYSAVYIGLGIVEYCRTKEIEALLVDSKPSASARSSVSSQSSNRKAKQLPSLHKATTVFANALGNIPTKLALDIWRSVTRDSSDRLVLRYISEFEDTLVVLQNIAESIKWNFKYQPEEELRRGEIYYLDDEVYIKQYKEGKSMMIGYDRLGRPIVSIRTKLHRPSSQGKEASQRLAVVMMSLAYMYQSEQHDGMTIIFDLTDWTLANMDNSLIQFLLQSVNKVYPMLVGTIFVHNAPKIFEAAWKVIKLWISPTLAERIIFTRRRNDLLSLISIDTLPVYLGGMASDRGGWCEPDPSDDVAMSDEYTKEGLEEERQSICAEFEKLTRAWLLGQSNQTDRMRVAARQRVNYWRLDPYIRRRTVFDRQGLLNPPYIAPEPEPTEKRSKKSSKKSAKKSDNIDYATRRQAMHFEALPLEIGAP